MGKLDGKVAFITGAAGGIGRATSKLFVKEGAKVVMADIWDEMGEKTADQLGQNAIYIHTDVAQEEDIKRAIDIALKNFDRLDIVFSNAGNPGSVGGMEDISVEDFDETIAIHLRAAFICMKHSFPIMKKQGSGCILITSSVAGFQYGMGGVAYSAAKAGIIQLTRTAAVGYGAFGIRVNAIAPGFIATGIFGQAYGLSREGAERFSEAIKTTGYGDQQAIRRAGLPEDIANVALFLASDSSSFITGITLKVDGGLLAGRIPPQDPEESMEQFYGLLNKLEPEDQKIIFKLIREGAAREREQIKFLPKKLRKRAMKIMEQNSERTKRIYDPPK